MVRMESGMQCRTIHINDSAKMQNMKEHNLVSWTLLLRLCFVQTGVFTAGSEPLARAA